MFLVFDKCVIALCKLVSCNVATSFNKLDQWPFHLVALLLLFYKVKLDFVNGCPYDNG